MEAPDEDQDVDTNEGEFVFVLEKATLETAKVGKVCHPRCIAQCTETERLNTGCVGLGRCKLNTSA